MAQPKTKLIILVVINTVFFTVIGAYGIITLMAGLYFRKMISFYGLISTFRIGKNWLMYGAILLVVFSIFYFSQVIMVAVNYYRVMEQNRKMKEALQSDKAQKEGALENKKSIGS
jgi:predicted membrane protein